METTEVIRKNYNARGWAIVAVSFLIQVFIFATCISSMGVYMVPVSESMDISRTSFTLVMTIRSLAMLVSAVPAGKLFEKYSMRMLMIIGTALGALCMFIFALAPSIIYFYLAGVCMGVSVSLTCNIPIAMLIKNWFDKTREGFALGIAFVGSGAGAMVMNPLYTLLIQVYGWRTSFFLSGIFILAILVPLIFFIVARNPQELMKRKIKAGKYRVKYEETSNLKEQRTERAESGMEFRKGDLTLKEAVKRPQTWAVFFAYCVLTFMSMAILNHGVPFMTDYGMSPSAAAAVISISSGVLIIGKVISGALFDRFGIRKVTIIETALMVLCITVFWLNGMIGSVILIGAFVVLYGIGVPVATLSMPLVLPVMYGRSDFGAILGMFNMTMGVGGIFQLAVSLVYDSTGSYYPAWIAMSVLVSISVIIFAAAVRPLKR